MRVKRQKKEKNRTRETFWNVPNPLSALRIILTFVLVLLIFGQVNIWIIGITFAIAAFTDFLDGQIARRFNQVTEIGRKLDMIADRFLMVGTVLAFLIEFSIQGILTKFHLIQIFMFMTREIITFPFSAISMLSGWGIPQARYVAKVTTALQGFGFSFLIVSIYYEQFNFSVYLAIATAVLGFISAVYYIKDVTKNAK